MLSKYFYYGLRGALLIILHSYLTQGLVQGNSKNGIFILIHNMWCSEEICLSTLPFRQYTVLYITDIAITNNCNAILCADGNHLRISKKTIRICKTRKR